MFKNLLILLGGLLFFVVLISGVQLYDNSQNNPRVSDYVAESHASRAPAILDEYQVVGMKGMAQMLVAAESVVADRAKLLQISGRVCGKDSYCNLMFWPGESGDLIGLPRDQMDAETAAAHYVVNRNTGFESLTIGGEDRTLF